MKKYLNSLSGSELTERYFASPAIRSHLKSESRILNCIKNIHSAIKLIVNIHRHDVGLPIISQETTTDSLVDILLSEINLPTQSLHELPAAIANYEILNYLSNTLGQFEELRDIVINGEEPLVGYAQSPDVQQHIALVTFTIFKVSTSIDELQANLHWDGPQMIDYLKDLFKDIFSMLFDDMNALAIDKIQFLIEWDASFSIRVYEFFLNTVAETFELRPRSLPYVLVPIINESLRRVDHLGDLDASVKQIILGLLFSIQSSHPVVNQNHVQFFSTFCSETINDPIKLKQFRQILLRGAGILGLNAKDRRVVQYSSKAILCRWLSQTQERRCQETCRLPNGEQSNDVDPISFEPIADIPLLFLYRTNSGHCFDIFLLYEWLLIPSGTGTNPFTSVPFTQEEKITIIDKIRILVELLDTVLGA